MNSEILAAIIGAGGALVICIFSNIWQGIRQRNELKDTKQGMEELMKNDNKQLEIGLQNKNKQLENLILNSNEKLEKTLKTEIKLNQKKLSVQYVTDKRVEWIYAVREELSEFISSSLMLQELSLNERRTESGEGSDKYYKQNKALAKLRLLFNVSGQLDREIIGQLNDIVDMDHSDPRFEGEINHLIQCSQIYLKLEWERVKLETKTNLNEKEVREQLAETEKEMRLLVKIANRRRY